ncbi:hypothetical protein EPUS_07220 [Endocarpon pusillum Z07020]|uniref:Homeobox domain-containing protein n=1 Tax=Endocarpon pusillum (strain Z07020 / HMAS-L-300199) TaxID=1263415 RepID=U1GN80_ENDPU|nr:uncharacterized protein EPUS_07220 [Endocarpon pusillum Z07020]ERF73386.1 hypothetical protein EPUS_07220 [Endocarpon pusillum Z07020]
MMTRQKRRRTSPEDHAVLEAAYQRNSKPDKAERTEIVNSVSLGEKEVQIWFQNRRQNDRRKSRPLLPHEMMSHFRNPIPQGLLDEPNTVLQDPRSTPQSSFSSIEDSERSYSSSTRKSDVRTQNVSRASSIHDLLNPIVSFNSDCSTSFESQNAEQVSSLTSRSSTVTGEPENVSLRDCQIRSAAPSPPLKKPSGDGNPILAGTNKKLLSNESNNIGTAAYSIEKASGVLAERPSEHSASLDWSATRRKRAFTEIEEIALPSSQNSGIRLSMTVDGVVKVKTTDEETPSPPKRRAPNLASLRNEELKPSHSAVAASEMLKEGQRFKARPTSGIFGRSRDARTWEFYCDGEARTALSAQAEHENNGSAVGAINLIRSQGQNARSKAQQRRQDMALKPKSGAGNTRKQAASTEQKPELVRAMSSMARLSSKCKEDIIDIGKSRKISHARSPSGDSDKENWAPGTRSSSHPLRRSRASSAPRDVLQDHHAAVRLTSTSTGPFPTNKDENDHKHGVWKKEIRQADNLYHGKEKEEDLDCIQGLLSLSQGAWK